LRKKDQPLEVVWKAPLPQESVKLFVQALASAVARRLIEEEANPENCGEPIGRDGIG
jgi:hypothetical protein